MDVCTLWHEIFSRAVKKSTWESFQPMKTQQCKQVFSQNFQSQTFDWLNQSFRFTTADDTHQKKEKLRREDFSSSPLSQLNVGQSREEPEAAWIRETGKKQHIWKWAVFAPSLKHSCQFNPSISLISSLPIQINWINMTCVAPGQQVLLSV